MTPGIRRLAEAGLVLAILVVAAVIAGRAWTVVGPLTTQPGFGTPNVRDKEVTVPDRPHDVGALMHAPSSIERRRTFTWSSNSAGFRGTREVEPAKDPGVLRVAVIGDCVAFGNGVNDDETWPAVLGRIATARGHRVEILNDSMPGQPEQAFQRLPRMLASYDPDLVLLAPGGHLTHLDHVLPDGGYRRELPPDVLERYLASFRGGLDGAATQAEEAGVPLVLVTPTFNSFMAPEGMRWRDATLEMATRRQLPVLDTSALFQESERRDGLVFENRDGRQSLTAYREGQPEELWTLADPGGTWVAPELHRWLDDHPEVAPLLSIDENHPNPRGHALIAERMLELLEGGGLLVPPDQSG